jgi:hypothetical protein
MNRLVEGLGIQADAGDFASAATRLASQGYAALLAPPTSQGVEQGRTAGGPGTGTHQR